LRMPRETVSPEILILVGLPGCGKTTYIKELRSAGWADFDDFKSNAVNDSPAFTNASRFEELVASLHAGRKCVVADIDFCRTDSREEASNVLSSLLPRLNIRWCFFEPDPSTCERNVRHRNRDSLNLDLAKLQEYSPVYHVPEGAELRPVFGGAASGR
jgi:AAA domain